MLNKKEQNKMNKTVKNEYDAIHNMNNEEIDFIVQAIKSRRNSLSVQSASRDLRIGFSYSFLNSAEVPSKFLFTK